MNDDEILEILEDNSDEPYVYNFLRELFLLELAGTTRNWKKTYDMIIDEYIEKF